MIAPRGVRLGFISTNKRAGSHYERYRSLLPPAIEVSYATVGLWSTSLRELKGTEAEHIERTVALQSENGWDGIGLLGAPMQTQNPQFLGELRKRISIPIVSAMEAGCYALRALEITNVLILTPFDDELNRPIVEFIRSFGIDARAPVGFEDVGVPAGMGPEQVLDVARSAFAECPESQAVYFQGARLDPLGIMDDLELDLGIPVISSNAAMTWYLCSVLGHRHSVHGAGTILREWPAFGRRGSDGW